MSVFYVFRPILLVMVSTLFLVESAFAFEIKDYGFRACSSSVKFNKVSVKTGKGWAFGRKVKINRGTEIEFQAKRNFSPVVFLLESSLKGQGIQLFRNAVKKKRNFCGEMRDDFAKAAARSGLSTTVDNGEYVFFYRNGPNDDFVSNSALTEFNFRFERTSRILRLFRSCVSTKGFPKSFIFTKKEFKQALSLAQVIEGDTGKTIADPSLKTKKQRATVLVNIDSNLIDRCNASKNECRSSKICAFVRISSSSQGESVKIRARHVN